LALPARKRNPKSPNWGLRVFVGKKKKKKEGKGGVVLDRNEITFAHPRIAPQKIDGWRKKKKRDASWKKGGGGKAEFAKGHEEGGKEKKSPNQIEGEKKKKKNRHRHLEPLIRVLKKEKEIRSA